MYGYGLCLSDEEFHDIKSKLDNYDYLVKESAYEHKIYLIFDEIPDAELLNQIKVDTNQFYDDFYFKYFIKQLTLKNLKITSAESLTGGLFQSSITKIPGSSKVFLGGIVSYSNEIKHKILEVPNDVIDNYGVVSEQTVHFMAKNAKKLFNSDLGIAFSGVAGPEKLEDKVPGTVWIGIVNQKNDFFKLKLTLNSKLSREKIRDKSVLYGIKKLVEII